MAIPTRKQQIDAVARFLDSERNEGRSLEEIAAEIVDGYLDAITPPPPSPIIRPGMLLKTVVANKAYRVAWVEGDDFWVVPEAGGNGWLGHMSEDFWSYCEEYRPKRRVVIDGKGKMVEMTDEEIAKAWDNPDHKVGDTFSLRQRTATFEVVAVGPQCALLRDLKTGVLQVDSNRNLKQYYRRETSGQILEQNSNPGAW